MIAPRRFWTEVVVERDGTGYGLRLDARPLHTPAQAPLRVPNRSLAEALAAEWRAIEGEVRPEALPFTRAVNSATDRVAPDPAPVVRHIAAYAGADLLCYRAEAPEALRARHDARWDPLIAWSEQALGAPLMVTSGVIPVPQPPASLAALHGAVATHDALRLTALHDLVSLSGSLVIGLAVSRGRITADDGWDASRIDETWQAELWGADAEAEAAAALRRRDFLQAAYLLELLALND